MTSATTRTSASDPLRIAPLPTGSGVLGVTICPGKKGPGALGPDWNRDLAADLAVVREWGATSLVTLLEPHEFALLQVEDLPAATRAAGLAWHHLPIRDASVPDATFERCWRLTWPQLRAGLDRGERIVVHCRGGLGRAGMVAALVLIERGMEPAEAVVKVRAARPGAIETDEQRRWVLARRPVAESAERRLATLLGGALGDALGYRVEFDRWPEIEQRHGSAGITLAGAHGELVVSDDTQMTLFTLEGMTRAVASREGAAASAAAPAETFAANLVESVREAYCDWYATQGMRTARGNREPVGALHRHPVLRHARAPGNTCLAALADGGRGCVATPINDSKGCGGVMRTAPLGFLGLLNRQQVFGLGVAAAALTHGHPDGYLPGGAVSALVHELLAGHEWHDSVGRVLDEVRAQPRHVGTLAALERGVQLGRGPVPTRVQLQSLGAGWVGEEALAIALCAAGAAGSFAQCIELAANHDGDSDSTASIAGQLYAARHGLASLPAADAGRIDVLEPLFATWQAWEAAQAADEAPPQ